MKIKLYENNILCSDLLFHRVPHVLYSNINDCNTYTDRRCFTPGLRSWKTPL